MDGTAMTKKLYSIRRMHREELQMDLSGSTSLSQNIASKVTEFNFGILH